MKNKFIAISVVSLLLIPSLALASNKLAKTIITGHSPDFQETLLEYEVAAGSTIKDAIRIINNDEVTLSSEVTYIHKSEDLAQNQRSLLKEWITLDTEAATGEIEESTYKQINFDVMVPVGKENGRYLGTFNVKASAASADGEENTENTGKPNVNIDIVKGINIVVNVTDGEVKTHDFLAAKAEKEAEKATAETVNKASNFLEDNLWIVFAVIAVVAFGIYMAKNKK